MLRSLILNLLSLVVFIPFGIAWVMIPVGVALPFLAPFGFAWAERLRRKELAADRHVGNLLPHFRESA